MSLIRADLWWDLSDNLQRASSKAADRRKGNTPQACLSRSPVPHLARCQGGKACSEPRGHAAGQEGRRGQASKAGPGRARQGQAGPGRDRQGQAGPGRARQPGGQMRSEAAGQPDSTEVMVLLAEATLLARALHLLLRVFNKSLAVFHGQTMLWGRVQRFLEVARPRDSVVSHSWVIWVKYHLAVTARLQPKPCLPRSYPLLGRCASNQFVLVRSV